MKLHYHPVSMTSRPLMFFIEDQGLVDQVEMKVVDLMAGEHHSPEFVKLNPNKLVPVLEDGEFVLTESSAIFKYIADKQGMSAVYPTDLETRARINEAMDWFNTQFYREYGYHLVYPQIFDHHRRESEDVQLATLKWGATRAADALKVLDQHMLGERLFVAGTDGPTIADYFGVGLVTAGEHIGVDFDRYPNVRAWIDRMKTKPAWAATHEVHEGFRSSLAGRDFIRP